QCASGGRQHVDIRTDDHGTLLSVKRNLSGPAVEFLLLGIELKPNEIAEVENFARLHDMAIRVLP
ncbi:hypothetical protein ACC687_40525, partial [Rhizobium ruizarguesonis]